MVFGICDDNRKFAVEFCEILKKRYKELSQTNEDIQCLYYENSDGIIEEYKRNHIDVVFMDIEVGSESGFDIARRMVKIKDDLAIVYITNHEYYATDAFVCRPLGFIRKKKLSIDIDRTIYSIDEYISKNKKETVFFNGIKHVSIITQKIMYVEVFNHDFTVVMNNNSVLKFRDKLKRVETELEQNNFIRINRNCMVNMRYIDAIEKESCTLINGKCLTISRDRITNINDQFIRYKIMH